MSSDPPPCLEPYTPSQRVSITSAKILLFDFDGTILNTMPIYYESWTLTSKQYNLPVLTVTEFYGVAGMAVGDIFEMLIERYNCGERSDVDSKINKVTLFDDDGSSTDDKKRTNTKHFLYSIDVLVNAKRIHHDNLTTSTTKGHWATEINIVTNLIHHFQHTKIIGVCSSGWEDHVVAGLNAYGLKNLGCILTSSNLVKNGGVIHSGKPAGDIWLCAIDVINQRRVEGGDDGVLYGPGDVVAFEDADLGMDSLRNAGVFGVDVRLIEGYPRHE